MESQLRVGDGSWIWLVRWSESREKQLKPRQKLLYIVPMAFALAYVGHAAYLWKQFGPPTGFCTKCFIYWGKHRISGGNTHWCEHAPLHWSVSGNKQEE